MKAKSRNQKQSITQIQSSLCSLRSSNCCRLPRFTASTWTWNQRNPSIVYIPLVTSPAGDPIPTLSETLSYIFAPTAFSRALTRSLFLSYFPSVLFHHETLVTCTRHQPHHGPTDGVRGGAALSPSPPNRRRMLLRKARRGLSFSRRGRICHRRPGTSESDWVAESGIGRPGLPVGRRRQRQARRYLGPALRHRCSLSGTLALKNRCICMCTYLCF